MADDRSTDEIRRDVVQETGPVGTTQEVLTRGRSESTPFVLLGGVAVAIWGALALIAGVALLVWWLG